MRSQCSSSLCKSSGIYFQFLHLGEGWLLFNLCGDTRKQCRGPSRIGGCGESVLWDLLLSGQVRLGQPRDLRTLCLFTDCSRESGFIIGFQMVWILGNLGIREKGGRASAFSSESTEFLRSCLRKDFIALKGKHVPNTCCSPRFLDSVSQQELDKFAGQGDSTGLPRIETPTAAVIGIAAPQKGGGDNHSTNPSETRTALWVTQLWHRPHEQS